MVSEIRNPFNEYPWKVSPTEEALEDCMRVFVHRFDIFLDGSTMHVNGLEGYGGCQAELTDKEVAAVRRFFP